MKPRYLCKICGWVGDHSQMTEQVIISIVGVDLFCYACPQCGRVDKYVPACDEPSCSNEAALFLEERILCFEHYLESVKDET